MKSQKMKFKSKIFLSFSLLSILLTTALFTLAYLYVRNDMSEKHSQQMQATVKNLSQNIDNSIDSLNRTALWVSSFISGADRVNSPDDLKFINAAMIALNVPRENTLLRVSFYNGAQHIYSGYPIQPDFVNQRFATTEVTERMQLVSDNGGYVLLPPHQDFWSRNAVSCVSVLRNVKSLSTDQFLGVVEVQYSSDTLNQQFKAAQALFYSCMLFDENGALLYASAPLESFDLGAIDLSNTQGVQVVHDTASGENYVLAQQVSLQSGWTFVVLDSQNNILLPLHSLMTLFAGILFFILAASVWVIYLVSSHTTKSIQRFSSTLGQLTYEELYLNPQDFSDSLEMNQLTQSFNSLLANVKNSAAALVQSERREMRANLMVLQAQMNPHFLYNMMSVIDAYAYEAGCDDICEICQRMSTMLRYVLCAQQSLVSIRDEIAHARDYLELMKFRYESDFTYEIHEAALGEHSCQIPRHCIQPILENCFYHGFSQKPPPWHIRVTVTLEEARWIVAISDNGAGFAPDKIKAILAALDDMLRSPSERIYEMNVGGMGLVNTFARLQLQYKEAALTEMRNEDGGLILIGGSIV